MASTSGASAGGVAIVTGASSRLDIIPRWWRSLVVMALACPWLIDFALARFS